MIFLNAQCTCRQRVQSNAVKQHQKVKLSIISRLHPSTILFYLKSSVYSTGAESEGGDPIKKKTIIKTTNNFQLKAHISCEHAQIVPGILFLKLLVEAGHSTVFWIQQFNFKQHYLISVHRQSSAEQLIQNKQPYKICHYWNTVAVELKLILLPPSVQTNN